MSSLLPRNHHEASHATVLNPLEREVVASRGSLLYAAASIIEKGLAEAAQTLLKRHEATIQQEVAATVLQSTQEAPMPEADAPMAQVFSIASHPRFQPAETVEEAAATADARSEQAVYLARARDLVNAAHSPVPVENGAGEYDDQKAA